MNTFLKNYGLLISLLNKKNIAYEIDNSVTLAPLLKFHYQNSNFKIQMELRDSLECTIYENNLITNTIPIYKKTDIEIHDHFKIIINERN